MDSRITVITIGVDDLETALSFYRDGLGLLHAESSDMSSNMVWSPSLICNLDLSWLSGRANPSRTMRDSRWRPGARPSFQSVTMSEPSER